MADKKISQDTFNRLKKYRKAKGKKLTKGQTQAIMDMEEVNKRGLSGKGTMTRKTKYGSRGKKFIGSTRSGEIVYEGQGRQGKRGKYFKRGAKGRVSGVSKQQGIEASRRGVPVPLGERGATVRSLAIPAQVPSANISNPPTVTTQRQAARRGLSSRTSIKDQRPTVIGSGPGTRTNRLKIPTSVSNVGNKVIGFLKGKAGAFGLASMAVDVGKYIGEVQHMGSQLEVEKKAKSSAGEIINMKYKGPVTKSKPSVLAKKDHHPPVKAKVQVKSPPKIEKPKAINKKVVTPKATTKAKGLSGFKKAFNVARYGEGGYEGKKFSYGGKSFIAVSKDDLNKRGMKSLGEWQSKQKASIKKLKQKGRASSKSKISTQDQLRKMRIRGAQISGSPIPVSTLRYKNKAL